MDQPPCAARAEEAKVGVRASRDCVPVSTQAAPGGWQKVCALAAIPQLGARVVKSARGNIAVFRTAGDEAFALADKCPHKGGPLSQGIVFGRKVACPLHGWNVGLDDGLAAAPDVGCAATFQVRVEDGMVHVLIDAVRPA